MNAYKFDVVDITPAVADTYLQHCNSKNRKMSPRHVDWLADQMSSGQWKFNSDPIRFSGNLLVDGQHRLAAIVKSGKTVKCLVARGLDEDVFPTIDCGKRRLLSDSLHLSGEVSTNTLAATLSVLCKYESGRMAEHHNRPHAELLETLEKPPQIRGSIHNTQLKGVPVSVSACFHYLFGLKDSDLRDEFFHELKTGEGLFKGDPAYAFRCKVDKLNESYSKTPKWVIAALLVKAWNSKRAGQKIGVFVFKPAQEEFPVVQ